MPTADEAADSARARGSRRRCRDHSATRRRAPAKPGAYALAAAAPLARRVHVRVLIRAGDAAAARGLVVLLRTTTRSRRARAAPPGERARGVSLRPVPPRMDDAADRVRRDVAGDARVLLQPPQRVLVPVATRRGRRCAAGDPRATSASPSSARTPSSIWNSYVVGRQPALGDDPLRLLEQPVVVRRDAHVATGFEQRLERAHEARLDGRRNRGTGSFGGST